ncbi:MAG: methyltransferase [Parasporobacterium sp.]|nr:methyltransferase [Parasporobacterium sp.]
MIYDKIPFREEEMQSGKEYRSFVPGAAGILKPDYPITVKDNLRRTMEGKPAWLPSDTEFFTFAPALIVENIARGFVIDAERIPAEKLGGPDFFGINWIFMPEARGSMVMPGNPLLNDACEWKEKVVFPDISSWDWEGSALKNKMLLSDGRPVKMTIYTGFFERLVSFMGMEGALIALIDEEQKEDVKELFDRLSDFYIELIGYMKRYYNFDVLWFHDDWGSQKAPMFSYGTVHEMIEPYLKKVIDAAHKINIIFEFHSCGKIEPLVQAIVDSGVDLWDGQDINDKARLSREYKGKLCIEVEASSVMNSSEDEIEEFLTGIFNTYDKGIFLGKTFKSDPKLYPVAYRMSRKLYNI